ncbi:hypothetical protein BDQ94DRAFT_61691 [Aspergillus welwitschiae]|uniref:Uncharacterized protein n=1 Tax=Aspergillus welwitschiae TaxID=1341132 RepID=A0A3F3PXE5_9EURO|nr:hypothetical protein BDQ94DRAFT_61691 [Aspergillus welwitschiae]RDH31442.1 hypothetical protein BDQ94DRAFT_61691 [Aspergillus welwitschiae]
MIHPISHSCIPPFVSSPTPHNSILLHTHNASIVNISGVRQISPDRLESHSLLPFYDFLSFSFSSVFISPPTSPLLDKRTNTDALLGHCHVLALPCRHLTCSSGPQLCSGIGCDGYTGLPADLDLLASMPIVRTDHENADHPSR